MPAMTALKSLLQRIHRDERGAVSLETILIVAAIALPILIFLIRFGWPLIRDWFTSEMEEIGVHVDDPQSSGS